MLATCAATADGAILADQATGSPVAGGDGRLLWSRQVAFGGSPRYRLVLTQAGRTTMLPVASRPAPFDVSVGETASGEPVAVYSRCRGVQPDAAPYRAFDACRLRQISLRTMRERPLAVQLPGAVVSAFLPTVSHGNLAFAARTAGRGLQLYVRPRGGRLQPVRPPRPDGDDPMVGNRWGDAPGPTALALRGRTLVYTWGYTAQRAECGSGGGAENDMLVIRDAAGIQRVAVHAGCAADAVASADQPQWIDADHVRFIADIPYSNDGQIRGLDLATGTMTASGPLDSLVGYAADGRGQAIGATGGGLVQTMPVLP
jgi:hypothetical protein